MSKLTAHLHLSTLKKNIDNLADIVTSVDKLTSLGLFTFLRALGTPSTPNQGDVNSCAHQASYCEGYNDALDDLMYFKEKWLTGPTSSAPSQDLVARGIDLALANGKLTEKEANDLRSRYK